MTVPKLLPDKNGRTGEKADFSWKDDKRRRKQKDKKK